MKHLKPLALTILTLAAVPAAKAQTWGLHLQNGAIQVQTWGPQDRYGDRWGYSYPQVGHIDRVSRVAWDINQAANYVFYAFQRNNRRPNWGERRAMDGLYQLAAQAEHFRAELGTYRRNPRQTVDDFRRLERAFYRAERALEQIERRPYVDQGMQRIYTQMNMLARYYGRTAGYGGWRSHGRRDPSVYGDDHGRRDRSGNYDQNRSWNEDEQRYEDSPRYDDDNRGYNDPGYEDEDDG